ncbi:MAG: transposase [Rhodobacteraceae bacterium]|nr:transposase [Paracoccaceae bacterium]
MTRLRPFFPKSQGKSCVDDLGVLSGISLITHNGLRWRAARAEYRPSETLCTGWKRRSDIGFFAELLIGLRKS